MRPIDADALKERYENTTDCALVCIDEAPTLDVRPNIHAHWIEKEQCKGFHTYCCSKCGHGEIDTTNFCSNCGAVMDSEDI